MSSSSASDTIGIDTTVNAILFASSMILSVGGGVTLAVISGQLLTTASGTVVVTGGRWLCGHAGSTIVVNSSARRW